MDPRLLFNTDLCEFLIMNGRIKFQFVAYLINRLSQNCTVTLMYGRMFCFTALCLEATFYLFLLIFHIFILLYFYLCVCVLFFDDVDKWQRRRTERREWKQRRNNSTETLKQQKGIKRFILQTSEL